MKEVNNAYWVAVNCFETKLVKNAMLTVPTMPAEKLSVNTIIERRFKFGSEIATIEKGYLISSLQMLQKVAIYKDQLS